MNFRKNSFKKKLFKAFLMVGIIPLIILCVYEFTFIIKNTEENIENYTKSNIEIASELIDSNVDTYTKMVSFIADNEEVQDILEKDRLSSGKRFEDTQKLYKTTRALMATQAKDIPLHIVNIDKKSRFSTTDYYSPIYLDDRGNFFEKLSRNEGLVVTKIHRRVEGSESKDTVLAIGKVIVAKNSKSIIGYIIADVYDSYFDNIFSNISITEGTNIILMDSNGYIITDKTNKNQTGFRFDTKYLNDLEAEKGSFNLKLQNKAYKGYFTTTKTTKIKVLQIIPRKYFFYEALNNMKFLILIGVFVILIAMVSCLELSKRISKPILDMTLVMKKVEGGDRSVHVNEDREDEIGELARGFNDMLKEINRLIDEDYKKEILIHQSEFKALKAQVNPHFLYNVLGTINWMAMLGEMDSVIETTGALAKFFRYNVNSTEDTVHVRQEMEQINNYLTIQKQRYKDRFTIDIIVQEEILDLKILKLMLQPLVENAIVHGLEPKRGSGRLCIEGYAELGLICFKVIDDGVGVGNSKIKGEGVGIENVDKRIKLYYGSEYGINQTQENGQTVFSIKIPKKELQQ
ncbi:MAG: two-component system sensor histidine kinase YesM [Clostridium sp.]